MEIRIQNISDRWQCIAEDPTELEHISFELHRLTVYAFFCFGLSWLSYGHYSFGAAFLGLFIVINLTFLIFTGILSIK